MAKHTIGSIRSIEDIGKVHDLIYELTALMLDPNTDESDKKHIAELITAAKKRRVALQLEEMSESGALGAVAGSFIAVSALDKAVFNFMGDDEKKAFQSVDPNQTYNIVDLDESGQAMHDNDGNTITHEINGKALRDDIIEITRESLTEEQKQEVDEQVAKAHNNAEHYEADADTSELAAIMAKNKAGHGNSVSQQNDDPQRISHGLSGVAIPDEDKNLKKPNNQPTLS